MNKLFTKITSLALGAAMMIGVGVAVASDKKATRVEAATGTHIIGWGASGTDETFASTSGTVTFAAGHTASFSTAKNSSGSAPAYNANNKQLRLYYASNGSGGSVTFSCSNVTITGFTLTSATSPTLKYSVNGGTAQSLTASSKTYTASGLSATSSLMFQNGNTTNTQLQISTIEFTYSYSSDPVKLATPSPTYNDTTKQVSWAAVSNASYYQVKVDNGDYADATSPYDVSGLTSGVEHTVYVVAKGDGTNFSDSDAGSKTFTPTAPKVLSSISVSGQTTTFDQGDTWEFGGTVTAHYEDETTADVTSLATFSGYDTSTAGSQTVTVSYGNKTTTYSITVNKVLSVTFIAGTDTGSTSVTKGGVTVSMSTMSRDDNYRCYANTAISISSSGSNIDSIVFTFSSDSYTGGFNTSYLSIVSTSWSSGNANGQARITQIVVTFESSEPSAELAPTSASSVAMMRGDTDTSVKVLVKNIESPSWTFTYDEGGNTGLSSSSNIDVSAGALDSDNISTLTITTKNNGSTGTTTLHISVSDGEDDYDVEDTIPVTVNPKPASMTIVHGDIHEGELEIITGEPKQVSFSGLDTDGNPYSIAAADVTPSATSGASYVTLSGSRITGASQGTAVVRYTLNALTSVYAEVTVNVVDDYIETVGTPTFATGLTDTQGQSPDVSVFTSRPGTMHSGVSTTIPFENYKFSYDSTYASAEYGDVFSYDFSHGTTVDSTHKLQTIYVFCDIDEAAHGSYTVTVEQFNDPLTAITLTNVVNNEVDVNRGSSFQLEWAYTPTNPTDGKEVVFRIDDNTDGIGITVSQTGLINISADSDLGTALVVIESAHKPTIHDYVYVTAALESMTYTVREEESWTLASSLSVGDRIAIVYENGDTLEQLSGVSSNIGQHTSYTTAGEPSNAYLYTVGSGNVANSYTFSNDDGYLAYTSSATSSSNYLHLVTNPSSDDQLNQVSWTIDFSDYTIQNVYNTGRSIRYNTGSPRFCCYMNKGQAAPKIYKLSGGDTPFNVTEVLFNGVHNNFGTGKTYEWDATCSEFDENAWLDACVALTEITNYSSYKLNRAVANESGNEIEVFLAKYDNIVRKFGNTHDHLDRFAVGGINHGSITKVNPLNIVSNSGTEVAIIVVASMIGLSAVGGYFFLRKRKEI